MTAILFFLVINKKYSNTRMGLECVSVYDLCTIQQKTSQLVNFFAKKIVYTYYPFPFCKLGAECFFLFGRGLL